MITKINEDSNSISCNSVQKLSMEKTKLRIVWRNVILFFLLHLAALHGLYLLIFFKLKIISLLWLSFISIFSAIGVTAGSHRYWSHKSYKAKWPLRLILMIGHTISAQNDLIEWCRDHRVHHKFSDTDADPHNPSRGFFFSHIGWLMVKKHDQVKIKGKLIDLSDLKEDSIVMFQKRHYKILLIFLHLIIPTFTPWYFWNENLWNCVFIIYFARYTVILNLVWTINSVGHRWGMKPYNKHINPTDNSKLSYITIGEGWHNYHHTFPWDYKSTEFGRKYNFTQSVIEFFAKIGWAYDLKTASPNLVKKCILRTDNERTNSPDHSKDNLWGWGDKEMFEDHKQLVVRQNI